MKKRFYRYLFFLVLCLTAFSCSEQSLDEELRELCKKENVYYVICQISKQDFTESGGYKFDNGRVYWSQNGKKWAVCYNLSYMIKYNYITESDGRAILYIYFSSEAARQSVL